MKPFNYDGYMKNNPLLQETDGYGSYKNPEKMLEDEGTDATNPWMEDVDGTDAFTMGPWKCYYDYPGHLVWSYDDMPFDQLAVYATPGFDSDGTTPIQVEVDGVTRDMTEVDGSRFESFQDYAQAVKVVLDAVEEEYVTNTGMKEDQDPYTYQSAEEFDLEPQEGPNDPLGPDEELMEGEGKVLEVYQLCLDAMRSAIKKYGLDDEDVQQLREKLAKFYS
jgi:hypothetical protein